MIWTSDLDHQWVPSLRRFLITLHWVETPRKINNSLDGLISVLACFNPKWAGVCSVTTKRDLSVSPSPIPHTNGPGWMDRQMDGWYSKENMLMLNILSFIFNRRQNKMYYKHFQNNYQTGLSGIHYAHVQVSSKCIPQNTFHASHSCNCSQECGCEQLRKPV